MLDMYLIMYANMASGGSNNYYIPTSGTNFCCECDIRIQCRNNSSSLTYIVYSPFMAYSYLFTNVYFNSLWQDKSNEQMILIAQIKACV